MPGISPGVKPEELDARTTRFFSAPGMGSMVAILDWQQPSHGEGGSGRRQPHLFTSVLPHCIHSATMATMRGLRPSSLIQSSNYIASISLRAPIRSHATHVYPEEDAQVPPVTPNQRRYWLKAEIKEIYHSPLMELIHNAATAHRATHDPAKIQLCTLMNIKSLFHSFFEHTI